MPCKLQSLLHSGRFFSRKLLDNEGEETENEKCLCYNGENGSEIPRCEYVYNAKGKVSKGSTEFWYRYGDVKL